MRKSLLCAVSLFSISWSGAAFAQAADTRAGQQDDEIIVMGEKADRSLQDTTTSVAVTTPRRIVDENIQSLQDIFQRTANVTETYGTTGFTIRGISNSGVTGGGNAALATVYVDGAAMPNLLQTAPTDTWDVAQVEILRGPQSTIQGMNSLAGAVIVHTTEATNFWELRGRGMITDADSTQFSIAGGGPLITDEVAFRVSVDKRDADGFTWNPTRKTNENPLDSTNYRAKLLVTPSGLPGFEARLGFTHYKRFGG